MSTLHFQYMNNSTFKCMYNTCIITKDVLHLWPTKYLVAAVGVNSPHSYFFHTIQELTCPIVQGKDILYNQLMP